VDGGASPAQGGPTAGVPGSERCLTRRNRRACWPPVSEPQSAPVCGRGAALSTATRKNEAAASAVRISTWHAGCSVSLSPSNGERRAIPLVPQAVPCCSSMRTHTGRARGSFPGRMGASRVRRLSWAKRVRGRACGIYTYTICGIAASYLAMSGASLRESAEILGTNQLKQTMKYTHLIEPAYARRPREDGQAVCRCSWRRGLSSLPCRWAQVVRAETPVTPSPAAAGCA